MKALGVMLFMVCVVPGPLAGEEQDDGGFIIVNHSERTPEETDAARKELLNIEIRLPKDRHQRLPKTMRKLSKGPAVRIVMLGDSIINDLSRSSWSRYLAKQYPDCDITCITCVKGGAGCWYDKKPKMLERYVLAQKPDLLIIGGISHQFDVDAIYECIELTKKKLPECEYLVMTGPFGEADPLVGRDSEENGRCVQIGILRFTRSLGRIHPLCWQASEDLQARRDSCQRTW